MNLIAVASKIMRADLKPRGRQPSVAQYILLCTFGSIFQDVLHQCQVLVGTFISLRDMRAR